MNSDQKAVATHALPALLVTLCAFAGAYSAHITTLSAQVAGALVMFPLIYSIATIGNKRFFNEDSINGGGFDTPGNSVMVDKAIALNTLEQSILALALYHALPMVGLQYLLPALVTLFLIGRVFFIGGYRNGAGSRAFGFGLTAYPTVIAYLLFLAALLGFL